jgi:hypothetical protein
VDLEVEGIALVLAHELAHHFGGLPLNSDNLSCEGQADFYGARIVMRRVWLGAQYLDVIEASIEQLTRFFDRKRQILDSQKREGERADLPTESTGDGILASANRCGPRPDECRIETFNAAVDLQPKPDCAE